MKLLTLINLALFTLLLLKDIGCQNDQVPPGTIIVHPQSVLAPLNANATFSCVAAANARIRWNIHHRDTLLRSSDEFDQDTLHSLGIFVVENGLIVSATEDNNGTSITCAGRPPLTESETAFLTVYSLPAPPANVSGSPVAPLKLNLTWDAPWTPSIPEVEIQVHYTVRIENLNSSQNSITVIEELQETHYVFSGRDTTVCTTYRFSVSANNDAGRSNESEIFVSSLPIARVPNITHSLQSLRHSVMFDDGNVSVKIMFEYAEFCEYYPVQYYSVMLNNSETQEVIWAGPYSPSDDGDIEIHLDSSDGIQENVQYLFTIVATNEIGNGTSEENDFYTTDVQYAEVSLENHLINITCMFAMGTEALGCYVELRPTNYSRGNPLSVNTSRTNGSNKAIDSEVIPASASAVCYDVLVRDWEADGTRGELDVPVDITPSEDELCFEPTESSQTTETPSPPPPDTGGQDSGSKVSSLNFALILGGGVGGVALVVCASAMAVLVFSLCARRVKQIKPTQHNNMYDKGPQLSHITVHPTPMRCGSQTTQATIVPIYDAPFSNRSSPQDGCDNGGRELEYSMLHRTTSQLSSVPHGSYDDEAQYAQLHQYSDYATLEASTTPSAIQPPQGQYHEIGTLEAGTTPNAIQPPLGQYHEIQDLPAAQPGVEGVALYSKVVPSAGTTIY